MGSIFSHLSFLYGPDKAPGLLPRVQDILNRHRQRLDPLAGDLTERDAILITYGDQVKLSGEAPLHTLDVFCRQHLKGLVSAIHILPFYPWTSDDGFSVVDYRKVDTELGGWDDIYEMSGHFHLMFDAVINHISAESDWFKAFLRGEASYRDYFIVVEDSPDLSQVVRPRALPLLTSFVTPSGEKRVWTTFSSDQIDLNYANPEVLLEILDILVTYVERGATFLRLDAIAYLWKEIGTSCINLPQAHHVIQFLRAAMDEVVPHVQLITETNIPHVDNISYFGDGHNEAQLVYNFALPPLTLHSFHTGDAQALSKWAGTLTLPSERTTFFNFLASHDGIGLNPARGILHPSDIDLLVQKVLDHGGFISYKDNPDGTESPYEMNINYFDALSNPYGDDPLDLQIDRFIAAQAVMLSLVGLPGIYFHSLFGSRSWVDGVRLTGRKRTINRKKCDFGMIQNELSDPASLRARVFKRYDQLLRLRGSSAAFHPHGRQTVLDLHPSIFALIRESPDGASCALCMHNTSSFAVTVQAPFESATDMAAGLLVQGAHVSLNPYQVRWMIL